VESRCRERFPQLIGSRKFVRALALAAASQWNEWLSSARRWNDVRCRWCS